MLNAQTHPDLNTGLDFSRNNPHVQIKLYAGRDFQRSKHSWSHVLTCIIHVSQSIFKQEEQSCWSHWLCCLFLCFCLFFCKLQLVFIEIIVFYINGQWVWMCVSFGRLYLSLGVGSLPIAYTLRAAAIFPAFHLQGLWLYIFCYSLCVREWK